MTDSKSPDDFDAAKKVFDELKAIPKDRQERILRWVAESFGHAPSAHLPLVTPPPHSPAGSPPTLHPPAHPAGPGGTPKDIRSFVAEKAPASDNQFAAVVAYYYQFEAPHDQRRKTIGGADLQEAARLAGRKRLSNPRMTLKNSKSMGYLDSIARGEFSINTVGENLVAMTLPGVVDGVPRRARSKRVARKAPTSNKRSSAKKGSK